jgi:hypothetical protein
VAQRGGGPPSSAAGAPAMLPSRCAQWPPAQGCRGRALAPPCQVPLSHRASEGGEPLARQLVDLYFTLFRLVVEGHMGAAAALRKQQVRRGARADWEGRPGGCVCHG